MSAPSTHHSRSTGPIHAPQQTLGDFLLAGTATAPNQPAVVEFAGDDDVRITSYERLHQLAQEYAEVMDGLGLGPGDRVVLELDTSADAIATILACSSLGLVFIPVSPELPAARLASILATAEPTLHLQRHDGQRVELPADLATGRLGPDGLTVSRKPTRRTKHRRELVTTDTAYIIFTSGTTAQPKGVVMSHRAVVAFYHGMLSYDFVAPIDRVASTSPLQFDFALLDIGLALGSGAAVVPVPRGMLRWPSRFLRVLRHTQATQVNGVPSIWRQVLRHAPAQLAALDTVRTILYCGETFPLPELRRLQQLLPATRIINCYGSTESMACSFADVPTPLPPDLEQPSIGVAHPGAEIVLVDTDGNLVSEAGVIGEIHLRSPALFTGYWDDWQATRAALVPDPTDPRSGQVVLRSGDLARRGYGGEFYFCGRVDSQVQIRGNRVELREIEQRLLEHQSVMAVAVLPLPQPDNDMGLIAIVVPASGTPDPDPAELISFCLRALPSYMVPSRIEIGDELPINANGKLDRAALAARVGRSEPFRGPARPGATGPTLTGKV